MITFREFLESKLDINKLGEKLSAKYSLVKNKAWTQTLDNCLKIATEIAEKFGFEVPSYSFITKKVFEIKNNRLWGNNPIPQSPSLAYLIVREGDAPNQIHISFEYKGKEYNYGHANDTGWYEVARIPLKRKISA